MKGVYTPRPALPRYNVTWDVNVALKYLKGLSPLESFTSNFSKTANVIVIDFWSTRTNHLLNGYEKHFYNRRQCKNCNW